MNSHFRLLASLSLTLLCGASLAHDARPSNNAEKSESEDPCEKKVIVAPPQDGATGVAHLEPENTHLVFFEPSMGKEKLRDYLSQVYKEQKENGCASAFLIELFEKDALNN